jgi:hypothetical protein
MSPGASHRRDFHNHDSPAGLAWPSLIALLFAALSMISFAVDQSVTLSPAGLSDIEDGR